MRIGELANKTNLSRDTIRYYERAGLIRSNQGAEATNKYRDYPDHLVEDLEFIKNALNAGFSVAELKDMNDSLCGKCDPKVGLELITGQIKKMESTLEFLRKTRTDILNYMKK